MVEGREATAMKIQEYPDENPIQAEASDQENQSVLGQNESTRKRAPCTVLTEVELVGLVCVSWSCPGGLPDVRDRQRAFCTLTPYT